MRQITVEYVSGTRELADVAGTLDMVAINFSRTGDSGSSGSSGTSGSSGSSGVDWLILKNMNSNKRTCIRVAECLLVEIENDLGEQIHGVTLDISNQGIGLRCSTGDRNRITPQGDFVKQGRQ